MEEAGIRIVIIVGGLFFVIIVIKWGAIFIYVLGAVTRLGWSRGDTGDAQVGNTGGDARVGGAISR